MSNPKKYTVPFIALTSLFFMWGFITVIVDAFIPRLRDIFELSYGEASFVQVAWFLAYLLVSIPAGMILSNIGYKRGMILGLAIAGFGCLLFYPAAAYRLSPLFALALFVLASGITVLQVAANPFVAVLGPEDKASSRLNLSQAFNSFGTTLAPIFAAAFLLSDKIKSSDQITTLSAVDKEAYYTSEAMAVQNPFIFIALSLFLLAGIFAFLKLPKIIGDDFSSGGFTEALKFNNLKMGIVAIFVYVGAEVAIGSYLVNYFMEMGLDKAILSNDFTRGLAETMSSLFSGKDISTIDGKAVVGTFVTFYWGGAMIGRFIGSFLMRFINPGKILATFTLGAIALLILTITNTGFFAMWTVLFIGLFNSIMFPTIFTMSIDGLGDYKPQASGWLCSAIFGGAVIPPLFGILADSFGFSIAFVLPIICYLYIMLFGLVNSRKKVEIS